MATQSPDVFIFELEQALQRQQEPIAILKLAAYAADAMRVLLVLERHADMSKTFDDALKAVCSDWKNPSAIEQPADLIAVALLQAIQALQHAIFGMEKVIAARGST